MIPRHHLPDDFLLSYAQGGLSEPWELAAATHLTFCPTCRRTTERFERLGGDVLSGEQPVEMRPDAMSEVLAMLDKAPRESVATITRTDGERERVAAGESSGRPVFPMALQRVAGGDVEDVKWRSVGGGVSQLVLVEDNESVARLLRIPPNMAVPEHGHAGLEITLTLSGSFSDQGKTFARGDVQVEDEETEHQPIADAGAVCVCLAVTNAPLKFRNWLPRLAQRFSGI